MTKQKIYVAKQVKKIKFFAKNDKKTVSLCDDNDSVKEELSLEIIDILSTHYFIVLKCCILITCKLSLQNYSDTSTHNPLAMSDSIANKTRCHRQAAYIIWHHNWCQTHLGPHKINACSLYKWCKTFHSLPYCNIKPLLILVRRKNTYIWQIRRHNMPDIKDLRFWCQYVHNNCFVYLSLLYLSINQGILIF